AIFLATMCFQEHPDRIINQIIFFLWCNTIAYPQQTPHMVLALQAIQKETGRQRRIRRLSGARIILRNCRATSVSAFSGWSPISSFSRMDAKISQRRPITALNRAFLSDFMDVLQLYQTQGDLVRAHGESDGPTQSFGCF
ncbi:MAG TPA: hypothetical protein VGF14_04830, partial [Alphaproteobacteria bacterium]